MFQEIIAVNSENYIKPRSSLSGQKAKLFIVKASCTHSYQ
jgi:hypothetical protein